ncbi:PCYCGC domain-containing protein [Paenibacillus mendelii]|uniref:PCYCGC domain-containing protein n=1 Tax=Paenibacillus mendelii TaxID=206163 RepID=A0ABV6JB31_9BACL|nr:PCYCGC domain-containing protein [Paenibacillus mendelii]MCQ6563005.1 PCYCGC domain-containing protein [Paenibacillus mendelii]
MNKHSDPNNVMSSERKSTEPIPDGSGHSNSEARQKRSAIRLLFIIAAVTILTVFILTACGNASNNSTHMHGSETFETTDSFDQRPAFLADYSNLTRTLYAEAANLGDILKQINCYCGCMDEEDKMHDSLYRCYIAEEKDGKVTWTDHSAGCGICLEEVQDIVKLHKEGKSVDQIRKAIDDKFKPDRIS